MVIITLLSLVLLQQQPPAAPAPSYELDIKFVLEKIQGQAERFFKFKEIHFDEINKEFTEAAAKVKTNEEHLALLLKLFSKLRDGQAKIRPLPDGEKIAWPEMSKDKPAPPGFSLCKTSKGFLVRSTTVQGEKLGVRAGMEILSLDGTAPAKWLEARVAQIKPFRSFSTELQASFQAMQSGLLGNEDSRIVVEVKGLDTKPKKLFVTRKKDSAPAIGPASPPKGLKESSGMRYGKLKSGMGYLQFKEIRADTPTMLDSVLTEFAGAPGLILDLRGVQAGECDLAAFKGRWIAKGKTFRKDGGENWEGTINSAYIGNVVILIDASVKGFAELVAAVFKEDGRAYIVGETHSAGSCSKIKEFDLPSRLFSIQFSTQSYKEKYNGGMGLEGVGVFPHETVEYDPKDLSKGEDTLIKKSEAILAKFPKEKVAYQAP